MHPGRPLSPRAPPSLARYTNNKYAREVDLPWLGEMPLLALMMAPVCFASVLTWVFTKSWLLNNILAFSLIIFFLTSVRCVFCSLRALIGVAALFL